LPFLYDDEAAKVRDANREFLGEDVDKMEATVEITATP